jgi:hypothetical protein
MVLGTAAFDVGAGIREGVAEADVVVGVPAAWAVDALEAADVLATGDGVPAWAVLIEGCEAHAAAVITIPATVAAHHAVLRCRGVGLSNPARSFPGRFDVP